MLSREQIYHFVTQGYLILRQAADEKTVEALKEVTLRHLQQRHDPYELETHVHYPGAPDSEQDAGGDTIRRLLLAYQRDPVFAEWARNPMITGSIQRLLNSKSLTLNPNHHNCVMTKHPQYSSQTNWHRDTRYWNFNNKYLINSWLALGEEQTDNGGMLILPGSHRWEIEPEALDEKQFLIDDHPSNRTRISLQQEVNLHPGDCLLFSAHCFHAAGQNQTEALKLSLVFTYHGEITEPIAETPSARTDEINVLG